MNHMDSGRLLHPQDYHLQQDQHHIQRPASKAFANVAMEAARPHEISRHDDLHVDTTTVALPAETNIPMNPDRVPIKKRPWVSETAQHHQSKSSSDDHQEHSYNDRQDKEDETDTTNAVDDAFPRRQQQRRCVSQRPLKKRMWIADPLTSRPLTPEELEDIRPTSLDRQVASFFPKKQNVDMSLFLPDPVGLRVASKIEPTSNVLLHDNAYDGDIISTSRPFGGTRPTPPCHVARDDRITALSSILIPPNKTTKKLKKKKSVTFDETALVSFETARRFSPVKMASSKVAPVATDIPNEIASFAPFEAVLDTAAVDPVVKGEDPWKSIDLSWWPIVEDDEANSASSSGGSPIVSSSTEKPQQGNGYHGIDTLDSSMTTSSAASVDCSSSSNTSMAEMVIPTTASTSPSNDSRLAATTSPASSVHLSKYALTTSSSAAVHPAASQLGFDTTTTTVTTFSNVTRDALSTNPTSAILSKDSRLALTTTCLVSAFKGAANQHDGLTSTKANDSFYNPQHSDPNTGGKCASSGPTSPRSITPSPNLGPASQHFLRQFTKNPSDTADATTVLCHPSPESHTVRCSDQSKNKATSKATDTMSTTTTADMKRDQPQRPHCPQQVVRHNSATMFHDFFGSTQQRQYTPAAPNQDPQYNIWQTPPRVGLAHSVNRKTHQQQQQRYPLSSVATTTPQVTTEDYDGHSLSACFANSTSLYQNLGPHNVARSIPSLSSGLNDSRAALDATRKLIPVADQQVMLAQMAHNINIHRTRMSNLHLAGMVNPSTPPPTRLQPAHLHQPIGGMYWNNSSSLSAFYNLPTHPLHSPLGVQFHSTSITNPPPHACQQHASAVMGVVPNHTPRQHECPGGGSSLRSAPSNVTTGCVHYNHGTVLATSFPARDMPNRAAMATGASRVGETTAISAAIAQRGTNAVASSVGRSPVTAAAELVTCTVNAGLLAVVPEDHHQELDSPYHRQLMEAFFDFDADLWKFAPDE